jgi:hypothetical protein
MKISYATFGWCLFLLPSGLLHAGIYGIASVSAGDGGSCTQTESGLSGSVSCSASYQIPNGPLETSYASATFNGLDASIVVNDGPNYYLNSLASVSITFSEWVMVTGGSGAGTLTGTYSVTGVSGGDFGAWPFSYSISQGGVSQAFWPEGGPFVTFSVTSPFTYGVPFEITQNIYDAIQTPGETMAQFTYDDTTYVDQNDDPVTLIGVPEPSSLLLLAAGLVAIGWLIARKRPTIA